MNIDILPVKGKDVWPLFAPHHYMSAKFRGCTTGAFLAVLSDGTAVGFTSIIYFPHAKLGRAWREHRTVIPPDFQGLGLGARLSDWLGDYVLTRHEGGGSRFFSRTSHPRLGAYREASPLWKATAANQVKSAVNPNAPRRRADGRPNGASTLGRAGRTSFSHEYVGRTAQ